MSLNSTIQFYIENNLINAISAVIRDLRSKSALTTLEEVTASLYSHYNSCQESVKNDLLTLYIKYNFNEIVLEILNNAPTYSNIDTICDSLKEFGSDSLKSYVNENFLKYDFLLNSSFISNNIERSAYIYLNTDLSNLDTPIDLSSLSFVQCVVAHYRQSEWLDYLISHNSAAVFTLWKNGITFNDDQLKSIDLLVKNGTFNPISVADNLSSIINSNIEQYVKCNCVSIINALKTRNRLNYNSYTVIDSYSNETLFDSLFSGDTITQVSDYSSSLLKKVNDYGLTHIFSYLKSNNKISNDVLEYLITRSDCNSNIKTLALCSFTSEDLTSGLKDSNYPLYLEIFRAVLYNDFLYGALHDSLNFSQRNDFDTNYCNEVAKCTSDSNLREIFYYVYSKECYNILACLVYEKDLESSDYAAVKSIDSEDFKPALRATIGNTYVARRAYRLLEHDCLDLFDYVVRNCFLDSDCEAFCFSDSHYMYSKYRDYLVSYMDANGNNYKNYSNVNLISILFLKLATNCSSTDSGILNYVDLNFSDTHYSLFKTAISFVGDEQSAIASIIRSHKSDSIFRDDENGYSPNWYEKAGTLLKFIFGEYITSYSSMFNDFIKICDYCYNGLIVRIDGVLNIQYTDNTFIYKLCHNDTDIRVVDSYGNNGIPFGVRSYSCINFANELCDNDSITDDSLISANSLCVIALRILKGKYRSSLPNNVRNYIINNWRLLIPYITECYKKGCDMDGYYILPSLSQSNFRSYVGYETNAHVQAVDQNPISYCYIKYTKRKIAGMCDGTNSIAENNLS